MENKAVSYCRVSSREQEETGYSLPSQEKLLTEYANRKELRVIKVFAVAESASGFKQRKVFSEMMDYMEKKNISILLCEKVDRLTRNLKEAVVANDWIEEDEERRIHFVKQNLTMHKYAKSDEKFRWDIEIVLAKKFISNLSEEVKKGQKEKIAQGWLPTRPPLGYKTIGEKGHKTHVVDQDKSTFILKMFELYSTGNYSLSALVDIMHENGLRNSTGRKVGKSRMHKLLTDPFYQGQIRWNDKVYPGKQKAIITEDLFSTVQAKISRKTKSPLYRKHLPVFKSKLTCRECTGTITWEIQKGHWYGHCNHYKDCDQNRWWRQEKVEESLFPLFDNVAPKTNKVLKVLEKALKESHSNEIKYHEGTQKEFNIQLEKSQNRIEAIYEDKIDGKIDTGFYDKKFAEYTKDKNNALEGLRKLNTSNTEYYEAGYAFHELASRTSEIYKSPKATVEDKRLLLSKIFSNLSINDQEIRPNYTLAFEFLREWIPIVNDTFEPVNNGSTKGSKSPISMSSPTLLRR